MDTSSFRFDVFDNFVKMIRLYVCLEKLSHVLFQFQHHLFSNKKATSQWPYLTTQLAMSAFKDPIDVENVFLWIAFKLF